MVFLFEFDGVLLYGYTQDISTRLRAAETHRGKRAQRSFYLRSQGRLKNTMLRQLERYSIGDGMLDCSFDRAKQILLDCLTVRL